MPSGVRRRKHERSKISKNTRRVKSKHARVNIRSNPIIAEHWDPKLTLAQNYKNLGLTAKLGHRTGGEEKDIGVRDESEDSGDDVDGEQADLKPKAGEGRIVRHEDGSVTVEYGDSLDTDSEDAEDEKEARAKSKPTTEVVRKLEELAASGVKKPRVQSEGEKDWIERLVEKHGDDYEAMFWDKKLNIYQQSVGDIKRRVYKWHKSQKK